MRVRGVIMKGVTCHADTLVEFPERGLVLVTGQNGSGKSSLLDAVSVGLWDEPLRKKPIWAGEASVIKLDVEHGGERLFVERLHKGRRTTLRFAEPGEDGARFDTKSKAQADLEQIIGPWFRWRRTHAFSSQDADHFTTASDGQRKQLLEEILGLERFDAAYKRALAETREADRKRETLKRDLDVAIERGRSARARLKDAEERLAQLAEPADAAHVDTSALTAEIAQLEEDTIPELEETEARQRTTRAKLMAELDAAKARQKRLDVDQCFSCGQAISPEHQAAAQAAFDARFKDYPARIERARVAILQAREQASAARTRCTALREERARALAERRAAEAAGEQRRVLAEGALALRRASEEALDAVDALRAQLAAAEGAWGVLGAATRVLGVQGVRAHLLTQALGAVEGTANTWLARLAGEHLRLSLRSYVETAGGETRDAIGFEVEGAGGGHGYRGASGGERRRIDIAMMLALAEIAEAANGVTGGTMFADEVFDALDGDGLEAAVEVLHEIAEERCVVVITHAITGMAKRASPAVHLHVEAGKVTVR